MILELFGNTHTPSYHAECQKCGVCGPGASANNTAAAKIKSIAEKRHREAFAEACYKWNDRT